nr:MAG TPA: hypothetical protein [Caudoviricetes sp.]
MIQSSKKFTFYGNIRYYILMQYVGYIKRI